MINWEKIEAGEYLSLDHRFWIIKTWDRIYGNHWVMQDRSVSSIYKGRYHETTLKDCKAKAEAIIKDEETRGEKNETDN